MAWVFLPGTPCRATVFLPCAGISLNFQEICVCDCMHVGGYPQGPSFAHLWTCVYFPSIRVKFIQHEINHFKVCDSVAFSTCTLLHNLHLCQLPKPFHHPTRSCMYFIFFLATPRPMEFPGQGSDLSHSFNLNRSLGNTGSSNPLCRAGDQTCVLAPWCCH